MQSFYLIETAMVNSALLHHGVVKQKSDEAEHFIA